MGEAGVAAAFATARHSKQAQMQVLSRLAEAADAYILTRADGPSWARALALAGV